MLGNNLTGQTPNPDVRKYIGRVKRLGQVKWESRIVCCLVNARQQQVPFYLFAHPTASEEEQ